MPRNVIFVVQIFTVLIFVVGATASAGAQETIAKIDFDDAPVKYSYSYAFAGYGPADGAESVMVSKQLKVEDLVETEGGAPPKELGELETKLAKNIESLGAEHPSVVELKKKLEDVMAVKSACGKAILDSTGLDIPSDTSYDYVGFGFGATYDLTGKPLVIEDPSKFTVSFDAKVSGTFELMQSKLMVNFVTADGDDEDDNDDVVLRLERGSPEGEGTFALNTEYKTYTFDLSDLRVVKGEFADLKDGKLTGVTFTVQAQDNSSCFGKDTDNELFVDNIKLIAK
jgi:hypothetical protein